MSSLTVFISISECFFSGSGNEHLLHGSCDSDIHKGLLVHQVVAFRHRIHLIEVVTDSREGSLADIGEDDYLEFESLHIMESREVNSVTASTKLGEKVEVGDVVPVEHVLYVLYRILTVACNDHIL